MKSIRTLITICLFLHRRHPLGPDREPPADEGKHPVRFQRQVMKRDNELGSVAPGKLADLILVNGDPTTNISDIRKLDTVIKGGAVMYPAEIWPALGVRLQ